jgi:membrane protease YdiL (CAAX protease family)
MKFQRVGTKSLRLTFDNGTVEVIEADRYDREDNKILLYRNDVVIAEYDAATIRSVSKPEEGPERGPGVLASVGMCVMYFVIFTGVGYLFKAFRTEPFSPLLGDYGSLPVQLLAAWSITLWRGLHWRNLYWSKLSFEEAFPLTRFPRRILPALVAATLGVTILAQAAVNLIPPQPLFRDTLDVSLWSWQGLSLISTLVFLAPVAEEMFFRGLVLHGFLTRYSRTVAVLASSILFALIHLDVGQAAFALPIGICCGWLYLYTRSLIPGMICHVLANLSATFLLTPLAYALGYSDEADVQEGIGLTPFPMLALAGVLFIVGGVILWRQLRKAPVYSPPHTS